MNSLLFLGSFAFLLKNVYGTVSPYRDSGDLISSAFSLGIAHPPGYSLYTLLTRAGIAVLPLGNVAYRVNVLSSVWTSLTVVLIFQIARKITSAWPALVAAMVWFLSPSVLRLSAVSEMYSLYAFFCALILGTVLEGHFGAAFFLTGLGMMNQPTIVFILPGVLLAWRAAEPNAGIKKINEAVLFSTLGLLGFSLVLFYPLRSFQRPLINWGEPETLRNLWRLITRADYGGLKLHPEESRFSWSSSGVRDQLALFARAEWRELGILGLGAAGLGLFRSIEKIPKVCALVCGATFLISGPLFIILSNLPVREETTLPILEPYFLMINLFALPWLAKGFERMKFLSPALLLVLVLSSTNQIGRASCRERVCQYV